MIWNKTSILRELKKLHRSGADLSYNALARKKQAVLSAAAYHFGSYRVAIDKAGIDYADVTRRPRWTKPRIIAVIKDAKRKGADLHWSSVTKRRDELGKAAFASLQPRLFGRWDRALHAAGLDADEVSIYRSWDRNSILFELRSLYRDKEPMSSGQLQKDDPGLYAAAVRHFGSYQKALRAAGIDPNEVQQRRQWTRASVADALKKMAKKKKELSGSMVRKSDPALYGASVRLFGKFTTAKSHAKIR
jgi:hypothetical protein